VCVCVGDRERQREEAQREKAEREEAEREEAEREEAQREEALSLSLSLSRRLSAVHASLSLEREHMLMPSSL